MGVVKDLLRLSPFKSLILQGLLDANKCRTIFYTFTLKNGFYCVTFEKWLAKLWGFAIINLWQQFSNRKSASNNK
jgi:hypothetical protein